MESITPEIGLIVQASNQRQDTELVLWSNTLVHGCNVIEDMCGSSSVTRSIVLAIDRLVLSRSILYFLSIMVSYFIIDYFIIYLYY